MTLARLISMALDKKMAEKPGLSLGKYIADGLWQEVLRGSPRAYRNWQRLWRLAEMFDEQAQPIIEICGGLPEAWSLASHAAATTVGVEDNGEGL